ncbi:hypothetical protein [Rhodococcus koreensis]|uniref:hypothetical protein n=1 Tax=Rhodococcus koreensis TaxID=99653 RepID=UPI000A75F86D|nr:hypothetical protein [Rhodococcus koreensis]
MDAQTTARPIPVEFTGSGGVRLAGDRWETDDRLTDSTEGTILLRHGGGQTRHSWDRTAARLAENR